jgi:hypothetical protein
MQAPRVFRPRLLGDRVRPAKRAYRRASPIRAAREAERALLKRLTPAPMTTEQETVACGTCGRVIEEVDLR